MHELISIFSTINTCTCVQNSEEELLAAEFEDIMGILRILPAKVDAPSLMQVQSTAVTPPYCIRVCAIAFWDNISRDHLLTKDICLTARFVDSRPESRDIGYWRTGTYMMDNWATDMHVLPCCWCYFSDHVDDDESTSLINVPSFYTVRDIFVTTGRIRRGSNCEWEG